jgi:hypothetical protein
LPDRLEEAHLTAVVAGKAFVGAKPHAPHGVLLNRQDGELRESFGYAYVTKENSRRAQRESEQYEEE